jgi:multiple sugar transport system permease protein
MRAPRKIVGSLIYHIFIIAFGFFVFYPVLWLIMSSLKEQSEIFQRAHILLPKQFMFSNYAEGWRGFGGTNFGRFFANSFWISTISTIGQLATASIVAYGFTRVKFCGRKFWFGVMIGTMLLPAQVLMIPQYILFNELHWIDTYLPLILPHFLPGAFFIFLICQFITGLPYELDEAAIIDGCNKFNVFLRIILPNIVPALITGGIFSFYWRWNDFYQPLLYIQTVEKYPASLALQMFADPQSVTNWGALFAMATLSLVPIFVIFLTFQRHLVEGISTSGLKG